MEHLVQATILEHISPPSIPTISHSCSDLASPVFSDFDMDTSDLRTYSINEDSLRTEGSTCTFRTTTYSIQPSSCLIDTDPGRQIQHYVRLHRFRNKNETSLLERSDLEFSSIKTSVEDENIIKLNKLRDYYKSQIRELPPLHQTAAAIISKVSSRAGDSSSNPSFHYRNTIETAEKTAPQPQVQQRSGSKREEIFNPKFYSTANYDIGQIICPNIRNESNTSKEKSELTWRDYDSSENKTNIWSTTYMVKRTKGSSRSNKSLQTMLTMENVTKLSEVLKQVNKNETYRVDNKIDSSETFRLTKSFAMLPSISNTSSVAEGCLTALGVDSSNCLNTYQLTDEVRASVINCLFRLDEYTGGNVVTLQCAVRFLDNLAALCEGTLPDTVLTCGVACFWVASKLQTSRVPGAASIARQCAGAFTPQQLVACERRVLAMLAFPSAPVVPADEVERLSLVWKVHEESGVKAVAHQLCCCALLHSHLAALTSIRLAAAALATALQLLLPHHPLVPRLSLLRSDEDGWSVRVALEQELKRVSRGECATPPLHLTPTVPAPHKYTKGLLDHLLHSSIQHSY